jgi:hypothetical protein
MKNSDRGLGYTPPTVNFEPGNLRRAHSGRPDNNFPKHDIVTAPQTVVISDDQASQPNEAGGRPRL